MERTLILIKPDALQRGLVGEIISRFERKGLKIIATKMLSASDHALEKHYEHHKDKPFFGRLKDFMQSSPLIGIVLEGIDAVSAVRLMVGPTKGREAPPGTIRGDLGMSGQHNLIHASDSSESATKEITLFFDKDEIKDWDMSSLAHIYSEEERHPI